jgi:hypothetical protein
MAEDLVDNGSVEGGRTGARKREAKVRRDVEDLWRVKERPGHHRGTAGDEVLWGKKMVTIGGASRSRNEKSQRSWGTRTSPGSH